MMKEIENDKIYYYTSDYVFLEWLKSEKIWATRSVSSNDSMDTVYALKHFNELKCEFPEYCDAFDEVQNVLKATKNFSLRVYKDIVRDFIKKDFKKFTELTNNANEMHDIIHGNLRDFFNIDSVGCINQYKSFFKEEAGDLKLNIDYNFMPEELLFSNILSNLEDEELEKYFQVDISSIKNIIGIITQVMYPYIISFSYNRDDRFLWDSYTNNMGVCLEFSKREIYEYIISNKFNNSNNIGKYLRFLNDIMYDDEEQKKLFIEFINDMKKRGIKGGASKILSVLPAFCKNPYWKPENECRAVFQAKYFSSEMYTVKENYNLKYSNGYKTQDYIEIPFPKRLLKSITTGPMNSKESLEKYIKKGLDRDIKNDSEKNNILDYFNKLKKESSSGEGIIRK